MAFEHLSRGIIYQGCTSQLEDANIVLLGAGYDGTSSYRPGSRFAPAAIRSETFYSQENYSPYFHKDLSEQKIYDAGDIDLPIGNKEAALTLIQQTAEKIFKLKKKPCFIGGEHLITLPVFQAALAAYPNLQLIQIDAHLDLMDQLFGDSISHGTVVRRIYDLLKDGQRIFQLGIRSGSKEEYQFAHRHTRLYPFSVNNFLDNISLLANTPVYLTLDLDVFDPSLLPATGTPEAGGIFFQEYIELLKALKKLNIIGCDVVELNPQLDPVHTSTIIASKILRELLLIV